MSDVSDQPTQRPGIGVDARGGAVIDPTYNVEALVRALKEELRELRVTDREYVKDRFSTVEKFMDFARDAEARQQTTQRQAETRRIDELAQTRQELQNVIKDMLAESVRTTSTLVSQQLLQIQGNAEARLTKLEAYQLTQAGRSSIADPAIEAALSRMNMALAAMQQSGTQGQGFTTGREAANARLLAIVMVIAAVAGPVIAVLAMRGH